MEEGSKILEGGVILEVDYYIMFQKLYGVWIIRFKKCFQKIFYMFFCFKVNEYLKVVKFKIVYFFFEFFGIILLKLFLLIYFSFLFF